MSRNGLVPERVISVCPQRALLPEVLYKFLFHKFSQLICRTYAINFASGNDLVDFLSSLDIYGRSLRIRYFEFLLEFVQVQEPGGDRNVVDETFPSFLHTYRGYNE